MQGVIYLDGFCREAAKRKAWEDRQDKIAEIEAERWLAQAETEQVRDKTMRLYEAEIRRLWRKLGYSVDWIDKQFSDLGS